MDLFDEVPDNTTVRRILKQHALGPRPVCVFIVTPILEVELHACQHLSVNIVTHNHSEMILHRNKIHYTF